MNNIGLPHKVIISVLICGLLTACGAQQASSIPTQSLTPATQIDTPALTAVPTGKTIIVTSAEDERPRHTVFLDAFWIDQTEVTVAMFRTFIEDTGYETTAEQQGWGKPWADGTGELEWPHVNGADWQHPRGPGSNAEDDHPVTQVSWEDAAAYCAWAGAQLPTEAQWEKACRGTDGRMWPWGDAYDANRLSLCESQCPVERWKDDRYDDGYAFTAPVGSFPDGASPYGALDMAGNLWEWVADWYSKDYYGASPYEDPLGPYAGTVRAMRGGAWYNTDVWSTCTVRHQNPANDLYDDLGFRCAVPDQP